MRGVDFRRAVKIISNIADLKELSVGDVVRVATVRLGESEGEIRNMEILSGYRFEFFETLNYTYVERIK